MKHKTTRLILVVALVLVIVASGVALVGLVSAQSGGGYDLTWNSIDGGGYMFSTGGGYSLGGTMGQPDAGATLSGGIYALAGGFWGSGGLSPSPLYLPLIRR
jgi:hypothetical protein